MSMTEHTGGLYRSINTATGLVRANDNDAEDSRLVLTVTDVNGDTSGTVPGTYGTLDWIFNGTFTYTLDNLNPLTDALPEGAVVTETFTYTLEDTDGGTDTTTLTITITGANDAPTATAPAPRNKVRRLIPTRFMGRAPFWSSAPGHS